MSSLKVPNWNTFIHVKDSDQTRKGILNLVHTTRFQGYYDDISLMVDQKTHAKLIDKKEKDAEKEKNVRSFLSMWKYLPTWLVARHLTMLDDTNGGTKWIDNLHFRGSFC